MERLLACPTAQVFEKKTLQEWDQVRDHRLHPVCNDRQGTALRPKPSCRLQVRERLGMAVRSLAALQVLQELVIRNPAVVATAFEFCITAAALEAPRLDR